MNSYDFTAGGEYGKRGYLKENYRIFNIQGYENQEFEFHYHEFHKVIFFFKGEVKYLIEGKQYSLMPGDILIVRQGDIHKPVISPNTIYERAVVWIDDRFLGDFDRCFNASLLLRDNGNSAIISTLKMLLAERDEFASEIMRESLFLQIMVMLSRAVSQKSLPIKYNADKQIENIISYINGHLYDDLTIEVLSEKFFISRYHLMHKFKASTGKTIYSYIQTKRLLYCAGLITKGTPPKMACFEGGYKDYSVFFKAFKKEFGVSPTEYAQNIY